MYKSLLLSLLIIVICSSWLYSQDLPHKMTAEEEQLWNNYIPPVNSLYTDPPAGPVRTMAEWEELQGIMITWTSYLSILRDVVDYAQEEGLVYIVCSDSNSVKNYLTQGGVPLVNLRFLITSYNSVWCRDYGPWTVYRDDVDSMKIIDWIYNRPRPLDDVIPVFFSNYVNIPIHQTTTPPYDLVATGGNFMNDGHGTGFSSKLILNENSSKTEAEIDTIMKLYMGIDRYIKMTNLPYDGIHHIDMHMKLLDEETLLVGQYPPGVADGPQIEANLLYILNNFQTCYGRQFKVVRIPMPPDAYGHYPDQGGDYRTYTNSIIINKTVIIPTYEYQYDTTAYRIYRQAMPGYKIVGINSNQIIPALGAIHCIVKEVGVTNPLWISHPKIDGVVNYAGPYEINAVIKSASGISDARVYWTTDTTAGYAALQMTEVSTDSFTASIPAQPGGSEVFYYINAAADDGRITSKPLTAPAGYYHFNVDESVPVELISFTAETSAEGVVLRWSTATEKNNRGFEVERSQKSNPPAGEAGVKSQNDWEKAGFVAGSGTTTEPRKYTFADTEQLSGIVSYRLKQIDLDGSVHYSDKIEIEINNVPKEFAVFQNYPNPFNPSTTISYNIPEQSAVTLEIYDGLGRLVKTLVNGTKEAGKYSVTWNGRNGFNEAAAAGIYLCRMKAGNFIQIKKMILLK